VTNIVDFRKKVGIAYETDQEQIDAVMEHLAAEPKVKMAVIIETPDGDIKFYNANNSPQEVLWAAKMMERSAIGMVEG
jgi:hypothetical protein